MAYKLIEKDGSQQTFTGWKSKIEELQNEVKYVVS